MSEREQAKQIIDRLPEYKIRSLLLFLKGMQFDDELYCRNISEDCPNDADPGTQEAVTPEELSKRDGIKLWAMRGGPVSA